jgi:hypothetical protein
MINRADLVDAIADVMNDTHAMDSSTQYAEAVIAFLEREGILASPTRIAALDADAAAARKAVGELRTALHHAQSRVAILNLITGEPQ